MGTLYSIGNKRDKASHKVPYASICCFSYLFQLSTRLYIYVFCCHIFPEKHVLHPQSSRRQNEMEHTDSLNWQYSICIEYPNQQIPALLGLGLDCRFERYGRIFLMCTEASGLGIGKWDTASEWM